MGAMTVQVVDRHIALPRGRGGLHPAVSIKIIGRRIRYFSVIANQKCDLKRGPVCSDGREFASIESRSATSIGYAWNPGSAVFFLPSLDEFKLFCESADESSG
jgi:hypothetical protein